MTPPPSSSISAEALPLILCIDDAEIALRVRKLLLGCEGYNVLTARSAEENRDLQAEPHPVGDCRPFSKR